MPVSEDVPLTAFTLELKHALSAIGKPCPKAPEVRLDPLLLPLILPGSPERALSVARKTKPRAGGGEGCSAGERTVAVRRAPLDSLDGQTHLTGAGVSHTALLLPAELWGLQGHRDP